MTVNVHEHWREYVGEDGRRTVQVFHGDVCVAIMPESEWRAYREQRRQLAWATRPGNRHDRRKAEALARRR